jgi:hypothetical protein
VTDTDTAQAAAKIGRLTPALTPLAVVAVTLGVEAVMMPAVVEVMVAIRRAACEYIPSPMVMMHCPCVHLTFSLPQPTALLHTDLEQLQPDRPLRPRMPRQA